MDTKRLTILHLSDLHFGKLHGFRLTKDDPAQKVDSPSLAEAIVEDMKDNGIKPNFVVVSGDLTSSADLKEFVLADKFLSLVRKRIVPQRKDRVIVAPGNHDICWEEGDEEQIDIPPGGNDNYRWFVKGWYGLQREPESTWALHSFDHESKGEEMLPFSVAFAVFDSCTLEAKGPTAGIGYVGSQIQKMRRKIRDTIPDHIPCLRVAVVHHHLLPVAGLEAMPRHGKKFSLLRDASTLLNSLLDQEFHLVLHGHQHTSFYAMEKRLTDEKDFDGPGLLVIGAGSAGVVLDEMGDIRRHQYNVIDVEMTSEAPSFSFHVQSRWTSEKEDLRVFRPHLDFEAEVDRTVPWHLYVKHVSESSTLMVHEILERLVEVVCRKDEDLSLRACLYLDDRWEAKLFLLDSYATEQMQERDDESVEWVHGTGSIGIAWATKEPIHVDWTCVSEEDREREWHMSIEQIRQTKDLSSALCVPIREFGGDEILAVLSVDSIDEKAVELLRDEKVRLLAESASGLLSRLVTERLQHLSPY